MYAYLEVLKITVKVSMFEKFRNAQGYSEGKVNCWVKIKSIRPT